MGKKVILIALMIGALLVTSFGCGSGSGTSEESASEGAEINNAEQNEPEKKVKVAVLIPSTPTDGGWGQVGAEGLKYVAEKLGTEPVIIEAATADVMKSEAEALAADGFDIVYGHGGQYASPFAEIADDYPDTLFVTNGGEIVKDNMVPLVLCLEEITYIQGVMAAHMTKSNKLGAVIGGDFPSYKVTSRAFELGAKSVNPDIEVLLGITQDSSDMNEGYELTMSQIQAGADIVFSNANQASQGSITAAKETNTYIFGTISDISNEAPDQTISTAWQDYGPAMYVVAEKYLNGTLEPGIIYSRQPDGSVGWVWNEKVKATLPEEIVGLYEETLEKILSGEIHVPGQHEGW
jgi:basic membrane lipoprotein Med (substrate-binding protein (PBP1-ABC) superfamily)